MILGLCQASKKDSDILPSAIKHMEEIADEILIVDDSFEQFHDGELTIRLLTLAMGHDPDWLVFFDADEEFSQGEQLKKLILTAPDEVNAIEIDMCYCLPEYHVYRRSPMYRIFRNVGLESMIKTAKTLGKMSSRAVIPTESRVVIKSHIPVYHHQVRNYNQGMAKADFYEELDRGGNYDHIRKLAKAIKTGDYNHIW